MRPPQGHLHPSFQGYVQIIDTDALLKALALSVPAQVHTGTWCIVMHLSPSFIVYSNGKYTLSYFPANMNRDSLWGHGRSLFWCWKMCIYLIPFRLPGRYPRLASNCGSPTSATRVPVVTDVLPMPAVRRILKFLLRNCIICSHRGMWIRVNYFRFILGESQRNAKVLFVKN